MPRTKGKERSVVKETIDIPEDLKIKWKFEKLQQEFKQAGFELIIRRPVSKDLVVFDYALMFTKSSQKIDVYVDEDLQQVIDHLLETNEKVVIKSNWLSPDTVAIKVPCEPTGDNVSDENKEKVSE